MKTYTIELEDAIASICEQFIAHMNEHYPGYNMSKLVSSLLLETILDAKKEKKSKKTEKGEKHHEK